MDMKIIFRIAFAFLALVVSLLTRAQEPASKPASTTAAGATAPATPRLITIGDYFQIRDVSQPELSPEGQWVAYAIRTRMLKEDKNEQRLWMISTRGGDPIPLTAEGASSSHPRWSPDGKYLSFLSSRDGGKSQVWLLDRRGGEAVRLT
jgi:Tol biopolymer transport system component